MTTPTPDQERTVRIDSDARQPQRGPRASEPFAPGTIIAGRYRISSLLGAGGMGEVYRADDTKLGQPVALKFLPARLARDPILLDRLHGEVRLGRQMAHPNVCRIYDIVEWEGAHFVSMEYVDGEDLSRLLRRIGRLAHDKAVDIARGIAAGLHAAHGKGILHRDLKPANVMVDSHGEARIMDFGLALPAGEDDGTISGTPAYMAPEQLEGQPATIQSDLYALGLVIYELFTGKRAHGARTLPERVRDIRSEITTPSSVIKDIDPAVERIILRCLDHDPAQRPRSAREVIEALPGGDPLAAALAAGETPSPRMVATAGSEGSLQPAIAIALLAAVVLQMAALVGLHTLGKSVQVVGVTLPPEVQAARARALLRNLGIPRQPFDAYGFDCKRNRMLWVAPNDRAPDRWLRASRGLPMATFWLREEPEPLFEASFAPEPPPLSPQVPPRFKPGSIALEIDAAGRLVSLQAVASPSWPKRHSNWRAILAAAGWSGAALTPTQPKLLPPSYADARAAWTGRHPNDGTPIRIEAASLRGTPLFLRVLGPWDESGPMPESFGSRFQFFMTTLIGIAVVFGTALAWRNLRLRRGDRAAAIRLGIALFALNFIGTVLAAEHELLLLHEMRIVIAAISRGLLWASMVCLVYLALEPYVRRRWPDRLISWTRLVSGNWRDPMVARDVLIGIAAGLAHILIIALAVLVGEHAMTGQWTFSPIGAEVAFLADSLAAPAHLAVMHVRGITFGMTMMILLMVLTIVLRRRGLAVAAFFLLNLAAFAFSGSSMRGLPFFAAITIIGTLVVARYGLLAAAVYWTTFFAVFRAPLPDSIAWYTARTLAMPMFFLVLAVWAFRRSLGNQKLFAMEDL